jgi:hypothetical protein
MQSQLAFSWRLAGVKREASEEETSSRGVRGVDASGRRVTFAVQNVPPSPLVYHAHHLSAGDDDDQDDGGDPTRVKQSPRPIESPRQPLLSTKPPLPTKKDATDRRGAEAAAYSAKCECVMTQRLVR